MQHLEEGTIHAWLDGALSAEESARVEQHVQECAECAAMVADARGLIAGAARIVSALDVVPGGVIPKSAPAPARRSLWRTLHLSPFRAALAASLMIAAASLLVVNSAQLDKAPKADMAQLAKVAQPMAAPAPATSAAASAREKRSLADSASNARDRAVPAAPRPKEQRREAQAAAQSPSNQAQSAQKSVAASANASSDTARRVADAVVAAAPPAVAADRRQDSLRAKVAATPAPAPNAPASAMGAGGRGAAGGVARRFDRVTQLSEVVTTSFAAPEFTGCYRVLADSGSWPQALPLRFALTSDTSTAGAPRNVVRGLDSRGRIDTTTVGDWRALGGLATVTLTAGGERAVFSLTRAPTGFLSQAAGTAIKPGRVDRVNCTP